MTDRDRSDWYAVSADDVLAQTGVEAAQGLSSDEAERRLQEHGPNRLRVAERRSTWRILLEQFRSIVVWLLVVAAVVAFATARWPEAIAVVAVVVVNTAIGFVSEWRAVRSMSALREMSEHSTRVRRDGEELRTRASEVVPGDIVLLAAGDVVPADLRLLDAEHLRVHQAALTGESVPADKTPEAVDAGTELAERSSMLYKGTTVVDGTGEAVAVATGTGTELGRVAELAERAESAVPPLQKRLDRLGRRLAWITVAIAALIAALGLLVREQDPTLVIETALALGIAAIPEGLPILATIALARGMYRMAERNALVNRLSAVETLGATRVVFTDKTGTLTRNSMRLQKVVTESGEVTLDGDGDVDRAARRVVEIGVLCNGASLEENGDDEPRGDPTETALLAGGIDLGIDRDELLERSPQVRVEEFDPHVKKMATFHRQDAGLLVAVKGAPEAVLEVCDRAAKGEHETEPLDDEAEDRWLGRADELADEGLRVLAAAEKTVDSQDAEPYRELCFLGLLGLLDPPRDGVKDVIDECQAAGIRIEMVTGDQPKTAEAIARAVGIIGDADDPESIVMRGRELGRTDELDDDEQERIYRANIFARVSPEQKLGLVETYQRHGDVVAMTGDGINDAPALKKADIGVAMGRRGTEAAKQVADMVLQDDALETIAAAVEQGRVIFANLRKAVMFILCTNVAEVLAVGFAGIVGWTLPLRPLQILYLNVLTDVLPALALGVGPGSGREMSEPPRDAQEGVLTRAHWAEIGGFAVVIAVCVLTNLSLAEDWLGLGQARAVTVSFLTLAFGKLWFTFALRDPRSSTVRNEITRNPRVWGAIAVCVVLLVAAIHVPVLSDLLDTERLGASAWALVLGMSAIPYLAGEILRLVQRRRLDSRDAQ